ncbi:hypothetical protein B5C01_07660 [Staphylococcus delphini]|uniref:Uncharacterized protein n=1 Tax=Staphylococcus delphini TaxID=53344 RepID=A0A2A4GWS7_9STAP|nr:hypothetical protein [Staphylococcus delphini]PCF54694.1 hypothetical protein B5C08_08265 [Staphylococcus delphini]PCF61665.1 hypothetical protein B5C01_07660 [Staphylococcus delphini]
MAMFREIFIWIILLVFSIINTISVLLGKDTMLNIPLWLSWLLFFGTTLVILLILWFRKYLQKRYSTYELIGNVNGGYKM